MNTRLLQSAQAEPQMSLGTASWHELSSAKESYYSQGDIWLSRLNSGQPVGHRDDRHILMVSGTRSGKGVSVIIPNLCQWLGSVVVIDPKGENALVTARRRGAGSPYCHGLNQTVCVLDPFGEVKRPDDDFNDLKASYNPLDIICANPDEAVDEAARMAEAMVVSSDNRDGFFEQAAKDVLKALILHVASSARFADDARNLRTLRRLILSGDVDMQQLMALNDADNIPTGISLLFKAMRDNEAYGSVVANAGVMLDELLESSPRTLMSILQVARTNTEFLDSPALQTVLGTSSFQLSDLKCRPTSLYLCLPQRYMESHYRWLRLMTTLILGEMERVRPIERMPHPVLMVLDEFPALKRMRVIENAAAQIAGYGVKLMFVAQTLAQLKDIYQDNWETMVANAGVKLFFGNDDHFTREYVSKLIGETEVRRWASSTSHTEGDSQTQGWSTQEGRSTSTSYSYSSSAGASSTSSGSRSQSLTTNQGTSHSESQTQGASEVLHKRMLITPDEVGRLFGNRQNPAMVALISGMQPLALKRTVYFGDAMFEGAYDVHPDHPAPLTLEDRAQQKRAQAQIDRMRRLRAEREKANAQPPETKPARSVFGTIFWLLVWCIIGGSVAWQVMQM